MPTDLCKQALKEELNEVLPPFLQLTELKNVECLFGCTKHLITGKVIDQVSALVREKGWVYQLLPAKAKGKMELYIYHPSN